MPQKKKEKKKKKKKKKKETNILQFNPGPAEPRFVLPLQTVKGQLILICIICNQIYVRLYQHPWSSKLKIRLEIDVASNSIQHGKG